MVEVHRSYTICNTAAKKQSCSRKQNASRYTWESLWTEKYINKFILCAILKIMTVQRMVLYKIPSRYLKNKTNLEELEIIRGSVLHT